LLVFGGLVARLDHVLEELADVQQVAKLGQPSALYRNLDDF
jgi:hypothetical protein